MLLFFFTTVLLHQAFCRPCYNHTDAVQTAVRRTQPDVYPSMTTRGPVYQNEPLDIDCMYPLETGLIFGADCVLPDRCGDPKFERLSISIFGLEEYGICYADDPLLDDEIKTYHFDANLYFDVLNIVTWPRVREVFSNLVIAVHNRTYYISTKFCMNLLEGRHALSINSRSNHDGGLFVYTINNTAFYKSCMYPVSSPFPYHVYSYMCHPNETAYYVRDPVLILNETHGLRDGNVVKHEKVLIVHDLKYRKIYSNIFVQLLHVYLRLLKKEVEYIIMPILNYIIFEPIVHHNIPLVEFFLVMCFYYMVYSKLLLSFVYTLVSLCVVKFFEYVIFNI